LRLSQTFTRPGFRGPPKEEHLRSLLSTSGSSTLPTRPLHAIASRRTNSSRGPLPSSAPTSNTGEAAYDSPGWSARPQPFGSLAKWPHDRVRRGEFDRHDQNRGIWPIQRASASAGEIGPPTRIGDDRP